MSAESDPVPGFWESRTGWRRLREVLLLEPVLGGSRWAVAFGSLLLFSFLVQIVTGVLLSMNYAPSVETAWPSVHFIQEEVPLGWLIRGLHHWGASAMVILLLVHMIQVFVWGAYKRPREFTWVVGVLLLICTLALAFTGYLLPWDQKAYWASKVGLDIVGTTPLIGDSLHQLLQGGAQMGNLTLTRFFGLHAFVIPGLMIFLIVIHLYLFRLHGVTPPWWQSSEQLQAEVEPFWPGQVWKDGICALVLLVGLGVWAAYHPAPLDEPANPAQAYEARPEWYFMFLFRLLRYFEGPYEIMGTFVLPCLFILILLLWPFLDRSPQRDPRRRPVAMGLLALGSISLVGLTIYAIATDVRMTEPASVLAKAPSREPAGPLQRLDVTKLYNDNCAACHGVDGSGKQIRPNMPTIPDLTSLAWQMSQTDVEITHRIVDGNEPLMPAYRDKLTQAQILALTIYVRAFAVTPASPPAQPAPPPSAVGMTPIQIYRAYCLACHDADGRGNTVRKPMPEMPDFHDSKWQTSRTDQELLQSILNGKGKFMLPMKDKLSVKDAEQMTAFVRAFREGKQTVPAEPQVVIPPPPERPVTVPAPKESTVSIETANRIRVAAGLYRQFCLTCHSVDGRGTEFRPTMPTIPDFTSRAWQETVTNPQLTVAILDGKGTLMPAFRGRVSDTAAHDLTAYLRAFGPVRATPEEGPATDFEKRFRQLEEEWRELDRQLRDVQKTPDKPG
jgi:quinol-cytochrome oxidoreductase complex cytochrome b subunit/mono/diheme cytochrome c family protein